MDASLVIETLTMLLDVKDSARLVANERIGQFGQLEAYPEALLAVVSNPDVSESIRTAAACALKDLVTEFKTKLQTEESANKFKPVLLKLLPVLAANWTLGPVWYILD